MLETAIIGGGLCGLALASSLHRQGREFALFEARPRLGGRILSVTCAKSGLAIDLGPTWFWPETQPLITQLVAELGLADFRQHDEGTVLHLRDADKKPEMIGGKAVHNGARRLEGGMARLVDALAKELPRGPFASRSRPDRLARSRRPYPSLIPASEITWPRSRRAASCWRFRPGCWRNTSASNPASTRRRSDAMRASRNLDGGAGQGGHQL